MIPTHHQPRQDLRRKVSGHARVAVARVNADRQAVGRAAKADPDATAQPELDPAVRQDSRVEVAPEHPKVEADLEADSSSQAKK